jgi:molecular chaperone GrpE
MKKKKPDSVEPQDTPDVEPDALADAEPEVELTPEQSLEKEREDLLERLQRVSADYMNYQKRSQREREEQATFAKADVLRAMLPVLDDMERTLDAARENHGEDDPFYQGIEMVHKHMLDALARFGCQPIVATGQPFNPDLHAAMMQQPTADAEPNTVLQEVQRGYTLGDKTIRPAGVVVAVAMPEPAEDVQAADSQESEE